MLNFPHHDVLECRGTVIANAEGLGSLTDYLNFAYFDARQFPYLMQHLASQGIVPGQPKDIPYRCEL